MAEPPVTVAAVIGGARGLGFALVEKLLQRPGLELVIATSRNPDAESLTQLQETVGPRLLRLHLDVQDEASVAAAAERIENDAGTLDLCMHVAGMLHDEGIFPERKLDELKPEALARVYAVNSVGPLLAAKHLTPLMNHGRRAVFAALSARVGSISDNRMGGWYAYRMSKAALNMGLRNLSIEWQRKNREAIAIGLHPGTVATDLSAPFQRNVKPEKLFSPEYSAERLLEVIDSRSSTHSGQVFAYDGSLIPE